MNSRNLTISLPSDLIRQAKVYAAERDTTINALIRDLLHETLSRDSRARSAAARLLALAERGPFFSVDPASIDRGQLHERG